MNYEWNENYLRQQANLELKNIHNIFEKYNICEENNYAILDIGCSNGYNTQLIFEKFKNSTIVGIDIDESRILKAVEHNKLKNFIFRTIDITYIDIESLVNQLGKYDIVYCSYVIQYLKDPQAFLCQCHKLLKPNGLIIIKASDDNGKVSYPYPEVLNDIIKIYNNYIAPDADRFCAEKCYFWLRKAGFTNISYNYFINDTVNSSLQEKLSLYYSDFAFRKFGIQDNNSIIQKYNEQLSVLYELFQQDDFYYSSISYIIVAQF